MLEIKANKTIYFDNSLLNIGSLPMTDFLMSSLSCPIAFEDGLKIGDLVHLLYDLKEFINLYTCEEYEVIRTLINSKKIAESKNYLNVYKSLELINGNQLKQNIKTDLVLSENASENHSVSNLIIKLNSKIDDDDELLKEGIEVYSTFTLLEIIEAIFEDFSIFLKK